MNNNDMRRILANYLGIGTSQLTNVREMRYNNIHIVFDPDPLNTNRQICSEPSSVNQKILNGGIVPGIKKVPFNTECYITHENIVSSYFQCTNPNIQHCCDAKAYIDYVNTVLSSAELKCPVCRTHEMDPQLYIST